VAIDERYLAAIGGCDDVFGRAETQPTVELYDSTTGQWSLLQPRLENPRTTAAVASIGSGRILVVGGAPSLSSAELYQVRVPQEQESLTLGGSSTATNSSTSNTNTQAQGAEEVMPKIADMVDGRMGCQAVVVNLPGPGASYPLADRPCVVIIGGERCEEEGVGSDWPRVRQFQTIPVFDVATGKWQEDAERVMPSMASARTAVALCVGVGYISPEPTEPQSRWIHTPVGA
jgi:hypothetical protein